MLDLLFCLSYFPQSSLLHCVSSKALWCGSLPVAQSGLAKRTPSGSLFTLRSAHDRASVSRQPFQPNLLPKRFKYLVNTFLQVQ